MYSYAIERTDMTVELDRIDIKLDLGEVWVRPSYLGVHNHLCTVCLKWLPVSMFYKRKDGLTGMHAQCIPCMKEKRRKHVPPKEVTARDRERNKQWRKRNPEACAMRTQRYRARKQGNPVGYKSSISVLMAKQSAMCPGRNINPNCQHGGHIVWNIDHIHPISRGGADCDYNLQAMCEKCNFSKSNKTMEEWKSFFA